MPLDNTFLCSILKYGVGISNDVKRLKQAFGVETFGYIDLRNLALRCGIRYTSVHVTLIVLILL